MIEKLTKNILFRILEQEFNVVLDHDPPDGCFYIKLPANSDFDHDVIIGFALNLNESDLFTIWGYAHDFDVAPENLAKAILTCHNWNQYKWYPTAFVKDNRCIMTQRSFNKNKPVSEAYLKEEILDTINAIWRFFCEFNGK
jgi:hypothetical protein